MRSVAGHGVARYHGGGDNDVAWARSRAVVVGPRMTAVAAAPGCCGRVLDRACHRRCARQWPRRKDQPSLGPRRRLCAIPRPWLALGDDVEVVTARDPNRVT